MQPKVSNYLARLRWCSDPRVLQMIELARGLLLDNAEHVAACRTIDAGRCGWCAARG